MRFTRKNGATSNVFRITLRNATTGQGLTGLTNSSTGLVISTIADVEASATAYTAAGSTIDTIATLGTFAAPTATHCRFKEVDSTNHPGLYELQIADARFAVSNAKQLNVTISGATNLLCKEIVIQLTSTDVDDATAGGISRLDAAVSSRMATYAQPTGFLAATFPAGTIANTTNITAGTITTTTNLTNLPSIPNNWLTAAGIAASALNGKGDWLLASSYTAPPSAAANATAVWQDLTSGSDFTTVGSIGKLLATDIDAAISSRSTLTAANVWDQSTTGHTTSGSFGAAVVAAGSAGDPWATLLPGSYGSGTAGHIVGHALPDVTSGAAGGLLILGTNTGPLSISNGVTISNSNDNQDALTLTATGAASAGLWSTGVLAGIELEGVGGTLTSGYGLLIHGAPGGGDGIHIVAQGGNAHGISATGHNGGSGLILSGGITGHGLLSVGGSTSGQGIWAMGTTGAASGLRIDGGPTGSGILINGGSTSGIGISILTTSGDGISITPTAGHAITATANGTSKHGLSVTGGTAGTSDGAHFAAGVGGVDIRGNITGNLTGTVTTTTNLTNLPAIPAGWLTAAGVAAAALNGKGDWTTDTSVVGDVQTALTNQGYTTTRAGFLDTLNGLVAAIWSALTSGMTTVGSIGKKLAGWVLGTDNKVLLSSDAQTGVTIPTVTTVTNGVIVTTNNDKAGYSLAVAPPTASAIASAVWADAVSSDFAASGTPGFILVHQLGGAFTSATSSIFTAAALANAPAGGGGGGSDPYSQARMYGPVDPLDSQGRQVFRSPPNASDGGNVPKVRFSPTYPRGGRSVELDPHV